MTKTCLSRGVVLTLGTASVVARMRRAVSSHYIQALATRYTTMGGARSPWPATPPDHPHPHKTYLTLRSSWTNARRQRQPAKE